MAAGVLDWTNAYLGRMIRPARAPADTIAERLHREASQGELPFLDLPFREQLLADLDGLQPKLSKFRHMLVLGIGGSALGARALQRSFFPQQDQPGHDGPWLWIADNVDAHSLEAYFSKLPASETLVVVISKSGGTIETISQYILAKQWLQEQLGDGYAGHLLLITDAHKGFLRQEAERLCAASLPVPDNLGGRYSALSAVGLVPAAFLGIDHQALLQGAADVNRELISGDEGAVALHPAYRLAQWCAGLMSQDYSELIFFCYVPAWAAYKDWFSQLWAESLGKDGKGSMPLGAVGVTDQHSVNQMFLDGPRNKGCLFVTCDGLPQGRPFPQDLPEAFPYLHGKRFGELIHAEALGTQMALVKNGVPLVELKVQDESPYAAGALMGLLEAATLLTGWMIGVNPLDQPAVELGKRLAKARLGAEGLKEEKKDLQAFLSEDKDVQEL
jgi:glucose-6-phosphate isomerase